MPWYSLTSRISLRLFSSFLLWTTLLFSLKAQKEFVFNSDAGDCSGAHTITTKGVFGPTEAPKGHGTLVEVASEDDKSLYYLYEEHDLVWYRLKISEAGNLSFTIQPNNGKDDIDFLLFQSTSGNACEDIREGRLKAVRANMSKVNLREGGATGLSLTADKTHVKGGPGEAYCQSLPVQPGEDLYLVVDHFRTSQSGHRIRFAPVEAPTERAPQPTAAKTDAQNDPVKTVPIVIRDAQNGARIEGATLKAILPAKQDTTIVKDHSFVYQGEKAWQFLASAEGYLFDFRKLRGEALSRLDTLIFALYPIAVGSKLQLSEIYFAGDKAEILEESTAALKTLKNFLKKHTSLTIEIQGHVNAKENDKWSRTLSNDRAKAIYSALIESGISKKRLSYNGYGNTEMIYPNPTTSEQARANRRVEIKVLSY